MQIETISWQKAGFSSLLSDYINPESALKTFYSVYPTQSNVAQRARNRFFSSEIRRTLCEVISEQYAQSHLTPPPTLQVLAQEHTCTVTTGHQLCLMTGPLYFIYKILTTINLAELLSQNTRNPVVPIFWLASEDHDFAEVNHFHWFGRRYEFSNSTQGGAVGKYSTQELAQWLETIPQLPNVWQSCYASSATWAEATRKLVHHLFGKYGLLVLDADDARLKKYFVSTMQDDLLAQKSFQIVSRTTQRLENFGYKAQIHARPINLFYMKENIRERIEQIDDQYHVLHTDIKFSAKQILDELQRFPERFSPNVVLRPLYQETILPNVAYIGGPAEIAYWLQLHDLFLEYQIPFPALVPRQSVTLFTEHQTKKIQKLGITTADLFLDEIQLKKQYTLQHCQEELLFPAQKEQIRQIFEEIESTAQKIDASLVGLVQAELHKSLKAIEHIEKKLEKAAEHRQETQLKQLLNLCEKIFPNGILQERYDNILSFYVNYPDIISVLKEVCQPFVWSMLIVHLEKTS